MNKGPVSAPEVFEEEHAVLTPDPCMRAADGAVARQGDVDGGALAADDSGVGLSDREPEAWLAVGANQVEVGERRDITGAVLLAILGDLERDRLEGLGLVELD